MRIFFTEQAIRQILLEVKKYTKVETGAILIGRIVNNDFYVFESLDSGVNCRRSSSIFYRDNPYSEHLSDVVRSKYEKAYAVGFWHRHPGGFNQFSNDDHEANIDMARVLKRDVISGLINIYNGKLEINFWRITLSNQYEKAEIYVGDKYFSNVLEYKNINELERAIINNECVQNIHTNHEQVQPVKEEKKSFLSALKKLFTFNAKKKINVNDLSLNGELLSDRILNYLSKEIEFLNGKNISCERYTTTSHQDKLFLSFSKFIPNQTEPNSCDVCFYFNEKGALVYYLDNAFRFEPKEFVTQILRKLGG